MKDFAPNVEVADAGKAMWRAFGLKRTKARRVVHDLLREALREERHMDAEALYRCALHAGERVSLATIYRVLAEFEQAGLVQAHTFTGMRRLYELDVGQSCDHMIDLDTGRIRHLRPEAMDACCRALAERHGVEVVRRSLTLYVRSGAGRGVRSSTATRTAHLRDES